LLDDVIEVPWAARHVENRIERGASAATLQCGVERGHAGKWNPRAGIAENRCAHHTDHIGSTGLNHGIVEIADDTEFRVARRHQSLRGCDDRHAGDG
jgi:hypothetical protein